MLEATSDVSYGANFTNLETGFFYFFFLNKVHFRLTFSEFTVAVYDYQLSLPEWLNREQR